MARYVERMGSSLTIYILKAAFNGAPEGCGEALRDVLHFDNLSQTLSRGSASPLD